MPKGKSTKKGKGRKITGRGAYYAGGMRGNGAYYPGGRVLRGRGGFFDDVGSFISGNAGGILSTVGALADRVVPGAGQIANGIRTLIGKGDYSNVKSNVLLAQPVPKVGSSQDKGIRYSHHEFLGDVTGSEDWELTQFHVNPGLPETFPWLSGLAGNFQKYRIDGLVFYLRSTSSVAIASTNNLGLGTILGGYQYNVYDKAPTSKVDFLSLSGALSGKPSEDHIYPMECDRSKNVFGNLLVRTVGVSDDQQKYDHAVFNLATVGFPGAYFLGELWVSYNITLMAPKVEQTSAYFISNGHVTEPQGVWVTGSQLGDARDHLLLLTPPADDSSAVYNASGWTLDRSSSGVQCISVPAGTSGNFLLNLAVYVKSSVTLTGSPDAVTVHVLDNSGTAKYIYSGGNPDGPIARQFANSMSGLVGTQTLSIPLFIDALPDRSMKLAFAMGAGSLDYATTTGSFSLNTLRLPDRLFADEGAAAVSLKTKVARTRKRIASRAAATSLGDEKTYQSVMQAEEGETFSNVRSIRPLGAPSLQSPQPMDSLAARAVMVQRPARG